MKIIRVFIMTFFIYLAILFISNGVKAVSIEREFINDVGAIKFKFTGLTLDHDNKRYEWGLTELKNDEVKKWYNLTDFNNSIASIVADVESSDIEKLMLKSDRGFITIREENGNKIGDPIAVDLKIPLLRFTNRPILNNGEDLTDNRIKYKLYNDKYNIEFQYEKINDEKVINKYKEIKNTNSNIYDIEDIVKKEMPTSNWKKWEGKRSNLYSVGGSGFPERKINVDGEGLYYMWIKAYSANVKTSYGLILVDNLGKVIALNKIKLPSSMELKIGEERKLNVEYEPTNTTNRELNWKTEDSTIASIDNEGRVKGLKSGSTKITATSKEGNKTATIIVNVISGNSNNLDSNKDTEKNNDGNKTNKVNNINKDKTTARGRLPQTGESIIIFISIIGVMLILIVVYNRMKNIK